MPDLVLDLLKYVFLGVLYIFVARAVRAVSLELRAPQARSARSKQAAPVPSKPPRRAKKVPRRVAVVEGPSHKGKSFSIDGELVIGRADRCHIVVDDTYVSQVHARIFNRDDAIYVEDMGSTNGTYLNRRKVTAPAEVQRGDQVKIGKTVLELRR